MKPEASSGKARLTIPAGVFSEIQQWARAAYPREGCGLLLGHFKNQGLDKNVVRFVGLSNILLSENGKNLAQRIQNSGGAITHERVAAGGGKTEFLMDPAEFDRVYRQAEKEGQDVVGILHTHPDHPPKPSAMDASQPMLAGWSNVIVAVEKGVTVVARSWIRPDETTPFEEESLTIVEE